MSIGRHCLFVCRRFRVVAEGYKSAGRIAEILAADELI
jgi:hypothetical protein